MALSPPSITLKYPNGGPIVGIVYGEFDEGADIYNVRQAQTPNQAYPLSGGASDAAITSVTLSVYDLQSSDPATAIYTSGSLTVSDVFKAALTVDGYWDGDTTGYNMFHRVVNALFETVGGHTYRFEYKVVTPNFGDLYFVFEKLCRPMMRV